MELNMRKQNHKVLKQLQGYTCYTKRSCCDSLADLCNDFTGVFTAVRRLHLLDFQSGFTFLLSDLVTWGWFDFHTVHIPRDSRRGVGIYLTFQSGGQN